MGVLVGKGESSGSARRDGCSRCVRHAGPVQLFVISWCCAQIDSLSAEVVSSRVLSVKPLGDRVGMPHCTIKCS